jgi:hypothetical protein
MEELDEEYFSEELENSDTDESEQERGPRYEKFRKEQLNKNFEFMLGMEFNSLKEFKDAIIEWIILNGHEITFVTNESYRVRVACKVKRGFLALCSKVGDKHTYQIKTLNPDHMCGRVLNNIPAKSKWVANFAVVNKMQTTKKVTIRDVINDMRKNHAIGITKGMAWKEKLIAYKILDGDVDKQYGMVLRYAAKLKRVCSGNNAKVNVERPNPTLQPRFGSFCFCFDGCKKVFTTACRPFVGVDGCHLKTKYYGQLLLDVARDPNDQYILLTFGVVKTKSKASWKLFMELLMDDIGKDKIYVFVSD